MKYDCKACNYETNDKSNFNKHEKSKSHAELINNVSISTSISASTEVPREYNCKCGKILAHSSSLARHKKTCVQPNLMNKLDQLTTQLAEVKKQNDDIKKQNDDIKKENDNIKKQLCKPSKTIINNNQTYNVHVQTFVQQNYPSAPLLKQLKDYEILDNYDEDEDSNLIEKLVHYQEEKLLDQFLGDFIIISYKKKNPKEQSLWTSDSTRLTYIIKELIENENEDEIWNKDPKAKRTSTYIIDPMLEYIRNNINIYFRINNKYLKSLDFKQSQNYREIYRVLGEIKMDIANGIIKKQIIRYITPYFQLNNTTTKPTK